MTMSRWRYIVRVAGHDVDKTIDAYDLRDAMVQIEQAHGRQADILMLLALPAVPR